MRNKDIQRLKTDNEKINDERFKVDIEFESNKVMKKRF